MIKLQHKSGRETHALWTLEAVERATARDEYGFAPEYQSGDYKRALNLEQAGLIAHIRGPRGGARYIITDAGRAALASVRIEGATFGSGVDYDNARKP